MKGLAYIFIERDVYLILLVPNTSMSVEHKHVCEHEHVETAARNASAAPPIPLVRQPSMYSIILYIGIHKHVDAATNV